MASAEGVLNVLREILVTRTANGDFVVVDREPREAGEILTLETFADGTATSVRVRVVTSTPVIRNGHVLHELRLTRFNEA